MKLRVIVLLLLIVSAGSLLPVPEDAGLADEPHSTETLHVLFVGNSFTYGQDMPHTLSQISAGMKRPVMTAMQVVGGMALKDHLRRPETLAAIRSRHWDYVVLQDCSDCSFRYRWAFEDGVPGMVAVVRAAGLTPILYSTWADAGQPANQQLITAAYWEMGKKLGVKVVPAGEAWKQVQEKFPELQLYDSDKHHAGPLGALLTAYVFAAFLGGEHELPLLTGVRRPAERIYQLAFPVQHEICDQKTAQILRVTAQSAVTSADQRG